MIRLVTFLLIVWGMMLLGGGVAVIILGGFEPWYDELGFVGEILKVVIAILLVTLWVVSLSAVKNHIFGGMARH
ncbi:MAG: hypothetical protein OXC46_04570 [Thaumarchaeota archaeon]|nr:hypothetical protein [Nitrososphaerota archaeon]